ncbi:hypothetical protein QTI66_25100 [Variovorax sp. J22R133]|uniref:hypothetical protein n=1 Tax=Variovorax brevis TaxID=3053503 RepID=UPI0025771E64|nr:hypothetical protein [Variovorax sp. J22R133]MDM0115450.1 hypothetical protein [Variovorax sp. J22R133]
MTGSVFVELRFWIAVVASFVVPLCLYLSLRKRRAISSGSVFWLGLTLVVIAAADVSMLHGLQAAASKSPSHFDNFFDSELAIGLYLIPALFGGIGIDLVSSVFRRHLEAAEHRYKSDKHESR